MSRGLGKVQIAVLRWVGRYSLAGMSYRHIRIMTGLSPQTLSRAIRRLCEMEYIKAEQPEGSAVERYLPTSKGLAAYAIHADGKVKC